MSIRIGYGAAIFLEFDGEVSDRPNHFRYTFTKNKFAAGFENSGHYANLRHAVNGSMEYYDEGYIIVDLVGYLDLKTQFP